MGQPLLAPAPPVLTPLGKRLREKVYIPLIVKTRGYAVADPPLSIWKMLFVLRIVAPEAVEHTGVKRV